MGSDISKESSRREEAIGRMMQQRYMEEEATQFREAVARSRRDAYAQHTATSNHLSTPTNTQQSRPANTQTIRPANMQPSTPANTQQSAASTSREEAAMRFREAAARSREAAARSRQDANPRHATTSNQPSTPVNTQPSTPANTQQSAASTSRTPSVDEARATPGPTTAGTARTETTVPGTETIPQAPAPSTKYNYSKEDLLAMNHTSLYPNLNYVSTTNSPQAATYSRSDVQNNFVYDRTAQQNYAQTATENAEENVGGHYSRASRITNGTAASVVSDLKNDYVFVNRNMRQDDVPKPSAPLENELPGNSANRHESRPQRATARAPRSPSVGASDQHRCACGRLFSEEIYQCSKGHSACVDCKSGAGCRDCGARVLNMRNYALEAHIRDVIATGSGPGSATGGGPGSATGSGPGSATGSGPGSATGGGPGSATGGGPNDYSCACGRQFSAEIYQCGNGHSACGECRRSGAGCRDCGMRVLDMRNYQLEAHVRELKMDCPNTEMGCSMRLRRVDMEAHLRECIYREMDCPLAAVYGRCSWRGRRGVEMVRHFDERHAGARSVGIGDEATLFRLHVDERVVHLALLHNYFFLVHVKVSEADQTLRMAVQLLGTKVGATKWKYEFNIYSKSEPRRKFSYADVCTPDGDRIDDVFAECRCLAIPLAYARGYKGDRGLNYKFYVTKVTEEGRPQRPRQRANAPRGNSRGGKAGNY